MSAADFTRILNNAMVHLPGSVESAVKLELFNVMDRFFKETDIWREQIPFTTDTDDTYEVTPTLGTIVRLIRVFDPDTEVPVIASMETIGDLVIKTIPAVATPYVVEVSLTCIDPVTGSGYPDCPDWIVSRYRDAFTDGLIAKMAAQSKKPYTDAGKVAFHGREFRKAVAGARADTERKNIRSAQAWQFPPFA
jgi:hypothetical protein